MTGLPVLVGTLNLIRAVLGIHPHRFDLFVKCSSSGTLIANGTRGHRFIRPRALWMDGRGATVTWLLGERNCCNKVGSVLDSEEVCFHLVADPPASVGEIVKT
jgi:hypothetical protein